VSHVQLPRTDGVPRISDRPLRLLRPLGRAVFDRRWEVHVHGREQVPAYGGQILAANHVGLIDGPLLAAYHPRPIHALTKREMFEGRTGRALRLVGQIPLDRGNVDPAAIKSCIRILREGGVVCIFPEGGRGGGELDRARAGVAYLALVTGAPVVPLAVFGTREPGGGTNSIPPRRSRIDLVYGGPVHVDTASFPRTQEQIRETTVFLHGALRAHLDAARALTGRELPGPLPTEGLPPTASTKEHIDD